jgi:glycosyltransferase involved in cell wall biosynthesis
MKKVLIIANDFPPIGGAGVQRAFYFSKFLPEFDWQPFVMTVKDVAFPVKDHTLVPALPDSVRIVRTESLELRRLLWLLQALRHKVGAGDEDVTYGHRASHDVGAGTREVGRSLKRWLFVPDDRMLWIPFVVPKAVRIIREEDIPLIHATAPPYSSAVIGRIISRVTKRPLVIDLRDPWTKDPYAPNPTGFHRYFNEYSERRALADASRVIVISPAMRRSLLQAYPDMEPRKVEIITNGFDAREFASIEPAKRSRRFVLAYVGSLYAHHREVLSAVCNAWSSLADRNPDFANNGRLLLVGRCDPEIHAELRAWRSVDVEVLGYQPHERAIGHLKGASALLLLIRDLDPEVHTITIPGKLFEYLGSGRRILMVGPQGDAAEMVARHAGFVHRQVDVRAIRGSLEQLFRSSTQGSDAPVYEPTTEYDRRSLTGRLAQVFTEVTRARRQP